MPEPGSPESRLQGARKQLGHALEDVDDDVVATDVTAALASTENALDKLDAAPETYRIGEEIVECACCGTTGLPERIHGTACPHDDGDREEADA